MIKAVDPLKKIQESERMMMIPPEKTQKKLMLHQCIQCMIRYRYSSEKWICCGAWVWHVVQ